MNSKIYIEIEAYDHLDRGVKVEGCSGRVSLPNIWIGALVKIISISGDDYYNEMYDQLKNGKKIELLHKKKYQIYGYDTITTTVKKKGRGAIARLPLNWVGKHVKIFLIEKPAEKED